MIKLSNAIDRFISTDRQLTRTVVFGCDSFYSWPLYTCVWSLSGITFTRSGNTEKKAMSLLMSDMVGAADHIKTTRGNDERSILLYRALMACAGTLEERAEAIGIRGMRERAQNNRSPRVILKSLGIGTHSKHRGRLLDIYKSINIDINTKAGGGRTSKLWDITKCEMQDIANKSATQKDMLLNIGYPEHASMLSNLSTLQRVARIRGVDIPTDEGRTKLTPVLELLENISKRAYRTANIDKGTKKRLIDEGYLKNECYCCGSSPKWRGKKIVLQIHHVDGDRRNNNLSNLMILCPNCHSQTDTYCGKKLKGRKWEGRSKHRQQCKVCSAPLSTPSRNKTGMCNRCRLIDRYPNKPIGEIDAWCANVKKQSSRNGKQYGGRLKALPLVEYLNGFSTRKRRLNSDAKDRIISSRLMEYKCSGCGNIGEYQDKELTLQIDHINGNPYDNRKENLRFLCPNCHSQTDTFVGKTRIRDQAAIIP